MAKTKSQFNFTIPADPALINQTIFNYLHANNFVQKQKDGQYYYEQYDAISGRRLFEYQINGNQVTIWAYVGSYKHPQELEGFVGALPKQSYKDSLQLLFSHLQALAQNPQPDQVYGDGMQAQNQMYQAQQMYQTNQSMAAFKAENDKKAGNGAVIGFVISLIGLVLSFFGFYFGAVIIFIEISLAVRGLHSDKKGFAIATIVIAIVSVLIIIAEIFLIALFS
ncbi:MAG: hypothetical protein ACI4DO_09685 [Roseburia sp.]